MKSKEHDRHSASQRTAPRLLDLVELARIRGGSDLTTDGSEAQTFDSEWRYVPVRRLT
jgi:hypothetical protein